MYKYIFAVSALLATAACSSVTVVDGDGQIKTGETEMDGTGCTVKVNESFEGEFNYSSETCSISVKK